MIEAGAPFLLLDDARAEGSGPARLYSEPVQIVAARRPEEVENCLERLRKEVAAGLHAAGFLAYEAGHALEPKLASLGMALPFDAPPLLWFGLFAEVATLPAEQVAAMLPDPDAAFCSRPRPLVDREDHAAALAAIKTHIEGGDVYQANFTFPAEVLTAGSPLALYARLRSRARAGHGGIIFTGSHWLLSFSPELFFSLEAGLLTARPMKGTAARKADPVADAAAAESLAADPKQRAENLMIVDLMRNDLARVAEAGSVAVPSLFAVETYPTVHQMTSTVTGRLESGRDAVDVIEAMFPCGSVTGAPKIRAMELIAEVESVSRGVYTGSIGRLAPNGDAEFNVAIRTLVMKAGEDRALIGLGSGIVADSVPGDEWRECLAKGKFLHDPQSRFDLIETMRFEPREGIADLDRHLARMKRSAEALGFAFNRHDARNELQAATFRLNAPSRLRLILAQGGAVAIETRAIPEPPAAPVEVALSPMPVGKDDFRLRHKTSGRDFYDQVRSASGAFETLFVDDDGFLTEGSFTSLFVEHDGRLLTPPLSRGLLPGILRQRLIEEDKAIEADLRAEDLGGSFYIGNAVRGLIPASLRSGSNA